MTTLELFNTNIEIVDNTLYIHSDIIKNYFEETQVLNALNPKEYLEYNLETLETKFGSNFDLEIHKAALPSINYLKEKFKNIETVK